MEDQEDTNAAITLKKFVNRNYSELIKNIDAENIAKWFINLEQIEKIYQPLWSTPLSKFDELPEEYPEEARRMLLLFPNLAFNIAEYINTRSKEEIETQETEIINAILKVLLQLFNIVYMAGYIDGQRNPEKTVLS